MAEENISKEVLLDGAQMTLSAFIAGTMGFLQERNIAIEEWVSYMGEQFSGSLTDLEGDEVSSVMGHLLTLQVLPIGAEVISTQGTADKAEATLTPLPSRTVLEKFGTTPRGLLRGFGVTQRKFASIFAMYEPAAEAIGLRFTHQLKNNQQLLSLEKAPVRGKPHSRQPVSKR